jgi:hypothetical protein
MWTMKNFSEFEEVYFFYTLWSFTWKNHLQGGIIGGSSKDCFYHSHEFSNDNDIFA